MAGTVFRSVRGRSKRRPRLETLEGRQLMSLASEISGTVNTTTRNAQFGSVNASSANGSSVVVWVDTFSATDHDILAQRLNSAGQKVGPEIVVVNTPFNERTPSVGMDKNGDFVVSWVQDGPGSDSNVLAQRFSPSGARVGGTVGVGVGTFREHDPSVAMDDRGDFVVAYTRDTNNNHPDVFAKRYDSANNLLGTTNLAISGLTEDDASVAMTPDGRFDVAFEVASSVNNHDILVNRYTAAGAILSSQVVAATSATETNPSVSMDNAGNAVIAWQTTTNGNADISARRLSASGFFGLTKAITADSLSETRPKVALARTGGAYVVVYNGAVSTGTHALVAEVSATDKVTFHDAGNRIDPSVSINGSGQYLISYTSNDNGDLNIRRRLGHL
ncbi:hypothetical protein [Paludisphaera rhizosphaerae]|uniref:hypothetical protein n=1 Tax=Paludisphaera rhizosphaerae TaxID=2711216 RepID=UPI0013EAAB1B|nr:hypothetical protein [Paludisphaera rhizosphaerae]